MSMPELTPESLTLAGVTAGGALLVLVVLWIVVRSAVLSALIAHQKRLANEGAPHERRERREFVPRRRTGEPAAPARAGEPAAAVETAPAA
ncbi:MAG: hypothetical protein QM675_08070, partial [Protaetiibacter sp.]